MSTVAIVIGGVAITTAAVKAVGPVALGGRDLPDWFSSVVVLLAPALLAALVATQALADGTLGEQQETAGVAAGGLLYWRTESIIGCGLLSAALTAVLRALRSRGGSSWRIHPMSSHTQINLNEVRTRRQLRLSRRHGGALREQGARARAVGSRGCD